MPVRRKILAAAGVLAATSLCGCAAHRGAGASSTVLPAACLPPDRARQSALTPEAALALLQAGNARFLAGQRQPCDLQGQVRATARGQSPLAIVVGCMDSRVPPELVFDQGVGQIFVARVAGNVVDDNILGSIEYATAAAGAPLVVVLGHSECGAIKGAVDDVRLGRLTGLLAQLKPAAARVQEVPGPRTSANHALVQAVAQRHAVDTAATLLQRSEVLRARAAAGRLKVAAAMHDVATGRVQWL